MTRLARLYRRRAEIQAELAEVDAQIADELAGEGEPPRRPRRRRTGGDPTAADFDRLDRALRRCGVDP